MIINQIFKKSMWSRSNSLFYLAAYRQDAGYWLCIFNNSRSLSTVYDSNSKDDYIYEKLDLVERTNICQY